MGGRHVDARRTLQGGRAGEDSRRHRRRHWKGGQGRRRGMHPTHTRTEFRTLLMLRVRIAATRTDQVPPMDDEHRVEFMVFEDEEAALLPPIPSCSLLAGTRAF